MARTDQYVLRYEDAERQQWQAAADRAGLPLAAWIRAACNLAAGRTPGGQARVPTSDARPDCRHERKRTGASGVLVCADCGKVNP
jgi:hypothetical protein